MPLMSLFTRLGAWFANSRAWARYVACFAFGALAAFAFPPYHLYFLLWGAFPAFFMALRTAPSGRRAFAIGWWFSFGLLTFSLYWIAGALFVDLKTYWPILPLAIAGLPGLFAIYYGLAGLAFWRLGRQRAWGPLLLAFLWFAADFARGHLFTGFPWDVLGYVWADYLPVAQVASLCGVGGLTLLTAWFALMPVCFIAMTRRSAQRVVAASLLVYIGLAGWGAWRLATTTVDPVPLVRLRLIQPDQSQSDKWRPEERTAHFEELKKLSFDHLNADGPVVTHVFWPETATAFLLDEDQEARRSIGDAMGVGSGRILMTGVLRRVVQDNGKFSYYNSLIAIDDLGRNVGLYDKHHLVPFGEYIPFRSFLPFHGVAAMGADFSAGPGPKTLQVEGFPPFSPLICYEAIFSGAVTAPDGPQPNVLVNVTNDAWYEGTTGPAQHFSIARLRAIEEGIPLVRTANKGVVAVVDPLGRLWARYDGKGPGFVDSNLPQTLKGQTLFVRLRTLLY